MKKLVLGISGAISFVIFLILLVLSVHLGRMQDSQQMATRWSEKKDVAQVSSFFSSDSGITVDAIKEFEYSLDDALQEASITSESENEGARLWADAYSADGRIFISSDRASFEADAIGIGGDFFLFHPLKLLSGSYFSGNDLNHDYCVIDEDAAWQLFGSNDVAGMTVYVSGIPHLIAGVIERPEGYLEKAAGLDDTIVYVSYETLSELGTNHGINHYEIVMPNPVKNFAANLVREALGANEKEVQILENTSRYSFVNRMKVALAFGTRSMNGKAIIYPFWENVARGYEDILASLTIWMLLFLLYPVLLLLVWIVKWWRHKGWTLKDVWCRIKDRAERIAERRYATRKEKRIGNEGVRLRRKKKKNEEDEWL